MRILREEWDLFSNLVHEANMLEAVDKKLNPTGAGRMKRQGNKIKRGVGGYMRDVGYGANPVNAIKDTGIQLSNMGKGISKIGTGENKEYALAKKRLKLKMAGGKFKSAEEYRQAQGDLARKHGFKKTTSQQRNRKAFKGSFSKERDN